MATLDLLDKMTKKEIIDPYVQLSTPQLTLLKDRNISYKEVLRGFRFKYKINNIEAAFGLYILSNEKTRQKLFNSYVNKKEL